MKRRDFLKMGGVGVFPFIPTLAEADNTSLLNDPLSPKFFKETKGDIVRHTVRWSQDGAIYGYGMQYDKHDTWTGNIPESQKDINCMQTLSKVWATTVVQKGAV